MIAEMSYFSQPSEDLIPHSLKICNLGLICDSLGVYNTIHNQNYCTTFTYITTIAYPITYVVFPKWVAAILSQNFEVSPNYVL